MCGVWGVVLIVVVYHNLILSLDTTAIDYDLRYIYSIS